MALSINLWFYPEITKLDGNLATSTSAIKLLCLSEMNIMFSIIKINLQIIIWGLTIETNTWQLKVLSIIISNIIMQENFYQKCKVKSYINQNHSYLHIKSCLKIHVVNFKWFKLRKWNESCFELWTVL